MTKALQLHPAVAGLWSHAAGWELEHNRNVAAARALMQRGLRLCKADTQLWVEYFRLELLYAHTLRARRRVLGIDAVQGALRSAPCIPCIDWMPSCLHWRVAHSTPCVSRTVTQECLLPALHCPAQQHLHTACD